MASLYQTDLPSHYRRLYRAQFADSLARGSAQPFVLPYAFVGATVLPVLYLSISHRKRPWLALLRFPVALTVLLFNTNLLLRGTSSASFAVAYAAGLLAAWGSIWGVGLLLFADVQTRVARVRLRRRVNRVGEIEDNKKRAVIVDESEAAVLKSGEWEHYWQGYPEEGTFWERLGWVWDLNMSPRGVGWNIAIPTVPHPRAPVNAGSGSPVSLAYMPVVSRVGYHRSRSYREFLLNRGFHIVWSYLVLDLWTVTARYDPYFVPGPPLSLSHPLPSALANLSPTVLSLVRTLLAAAGTLGALNHIFNLAQVISALSPFARYNPLWQHPSINGSFSLTVLDEGLAGFWGGWWHQSFRLGFTLPTAYLVRMGWLPPARTVVTKRVGMFIAFLLSGLMHSAADCSAVPKMTDARTPMLFFLLQFVGVVVQEILVKGVRRMMGQEKIPRMWKRVGNLIFVAAWLHWTNELLIGDMSRGALWLHEPVPWSLLRAMGFGPPGDLSWRWDIEYIPKWHWGQHWWESGVRL